MSLKKQQKHLQEKKKKEKNKNKKPNWSKGLKKEKANFLRIILETTNNSLFNSCMYWPF